MSFAKKFLVIVSLFLICISQSGCQLLQLPFQMIGGLFNLAGKALQVADSLPKPPPGVFF